jgi:hypothetical protein
MVLNEMCGNAHIADFRLAPTPSAESCWSYTRTIATTPSSVRPFSVQARYGPFQGLHDMDLPSSQSARSIEPRPAGSVYKAAVCSTRDSVLDASLSCGYNRISIDNKISTDRPGSDPAGRPLIHPRSQHYPTGSKPSTAGRPEWPAGLTAEAIPVFRQSELVMRLGQSSTSSYWCGGGICP